MAKRKVLTTTNGKLTIKRSFKRFHFAMSFSLQVDYWPSIGPRMVVDDVLLAVDGTVEGDPGPLVVVGELVRHLDVVVHVPLLDEGDDEEPDGSVGFVVDALGKVERFVLPVPHRLVVALHRVDGRLVLEAVNLGGVDFPFAVRIAEHAIEDDETARAVGEVESDVLHVPDRKNGFHSFPPLNCYSVFPGAASAFFMAKRSAMTVISSGCFMKR